jgi:hypothetical protein
LGLPTAVGRSTKEAFQYILARVKGAIGSWNGREASCAGSEILLKSVAQAILTYSMSCFPLPVDTCDKMKTSIARCDGSASQNQSAEVEWDFET